MIFVITIANSSRNDVDHSACHRGYMDELAADAIASETVLKIAAYSVPNFTFDVGCTHTVETRISARNLAR